MKDEEAKEIYTNLIESLEHFFIVHFQFRVSKDKDDNLFITEYFDDETYNLSGFLTQELIEDFMDFELDKNEDSFILENCKNTGMYCVHILFELESDCDNYRQWEWLNPLHLEEIIYYTNEQLLEEEEEEESLDKLPF